MKIALITPHYYPAVRGNAVTVRRIERRLREAGRQVSLYSLDAMSAEEICGRLAEEKPDIIHAFHAWLGGRVARLVSLQTAIPYIVTLTGSDVYEALTDKRMEETHAALRDAAGLVAFHQSIKKRLAAHLPSLAEKTAIIPQGVELPGDDCQGLGGFPFFTGKCAFLLPAGLRPVKNVLFPLAPLAELFQRQPSLRFIMAGPVLDKAYGAQVMEELERYPFAHYIGGIGHDAIGCLYKKADVVLNTSLFEGGMANSVLEAMAFGKPLLASDIEGNRSIIKEGKNGFLYRDESGFREKAGRLIADPKLRKSLGGMGRRLVVEEFPPDREAAAYLEIYRSILAR